MTSTRLALQTRSASRIIRDNVVEQPTLVPHSRDIAVLMPFVQGAETKELVHVGTDDDSYLSAYFAWTNKGFFSTGDPKDPHDLHEKAAIVQTVCEVGAASHNRCCPQCVLIYLFVCV